MSNINPVVSPDGEINAVIQRTYNDLISGELEPITPIINLYDEEFAITIPEPNLITVSSIDEVSNINIPESINAVVTYSVDKILDDATGFVYYASYGDASPQKIFTIPTTQSLDFMSVTVGTTWNGSGAYILIGDGSNASLFFGSGEVELSLSATFEKGFVYQGLPTDIYLTIYPGGGATQGTITIQGSTTKGA